MTSLFWLSNVTGGESACAKGSFWRICWTQLLDSYIPTVDLPVGRLWRRAMWPPAPSGSRTLFITITGAEASPVQGGSPP
ncbi:MAG: hypothetical protein ACLUNZ_12185 [Evtepia sp.]